MRDSARREEYEKTGTYGEPPEAERLFVSVFTQVASRFGARHSLLSETERALRDRWDDMARQIAHCEKSASIVSEMLERLKGDGLIRTELEKQKASHQTQITHQKKQIEVIKDAIKLVSHYEYDWDESPGMWKTEGISYRITF